jgi:hypothetical protein
MKISKSVAIIFTIVVLIALVGVGIWVGTRLSGGGSSSSALSPYSAVYLSDGNVYFGTLSWVPSPHIDDAWFLEHGTDAKGDPTVNVYPFSQVAWGPSETVYFNSQQIIFWTRLAATSDVAQLMADPAAATAAEQAAAAAEVPAVPTATSTPSSPSGGSQ